MNIIMDAMGGDNAPEAIVKGSIEALREYDVKITFSGKEEEIKKYLNIEKNLLNRIEIINAEDVITNEDKPVKAIRKKKDSSMVKGMNALKDGFGDAFVSAGNTGAILSGGLFIVGRLPGIERPCLAPLFPNGERFSLLMDAGANVDCKPLFLNQFALMGSIYMENVLKIENPKVGLINIGTEEGKGNKLVNDTFKLLKESELNFIGNIEARDILSNDADILVCDGFVGNVVLKLMEGVVSELMGRMKNEILKTTKGKIGGYLIKDSMKRLKDKLDYSEHGGAPLLGLKAPVIKAHGSSDSTAIKNAIRQSKIFLDSGVNEIIKEELDRGGNDN
ncbi:phosphate:acyl-[acyl carrier protein] acyltransferase [Dethiosulfatibacter aminovorans DSM 17477]|uniref:Phosphate acyltransferase n=1 Tax=Dethiosulfatibacter aminovorans DSM 17477 TaxID=1121476 RepID=A0A1M6DGH8_9FIRM|nr:phosphate acyltransferase PlsX [Dethiosulfatibacter aminovorans]SHI72444.1 phosphate:acyl-[acyl carrier protein] acyltransferase [Dethiosulfatibacter aminovorans DSM 17477]